MPNDSGIPNDWERFKTTVDDVEALSGYDLLALLPDPIEIAIESNTKPPEAVADGPYTSLPHLSIALSGAGSSDPDGDALSYAWSFGDGAEATGVATSHAYAAAGSYPVRLIVTDIRGLADTAFTTATVITPTQAIRDVSAEIDALVARHVLDIGDGKWVQNKLDIAVKLLARGLRVPAINQLEECVRRLEEVHVPAPADRLRRIITSLTVEEHS